MLANNKMFKCKQAELVEPNNGLDHDASAANKSIF